MPVMLVVIVIVRGKARVSNGHAAVARKDLGLVNAADHVADHAAPALVAGTNDRLEAGATASPAAL